MILFTVEQWGHYLLQAEFFIHINHRSLIHLNEQRLHTAWQVVTEGVPPPAQIALQDHIQERDGEWCGRCLVPPSPATTELCNFLSGFVVASWLSVCSRGFGLVDTVGCSTTGLAPFTLLQGVLRHKNRI